MKRCPITYEIISDQQDYSARGLRLLSPQLTHLEHLDYSAAEQRDEAIARVGKMSVQGVQAKISAQLNVKEGRFELVDQSGHYILKPQSDHYPELPQNEALTMTLAASFGIEVPVHGLVYSKDKSMTYFIKRFDRTGRNKRIAVEDFAQLSQQSSDTKYRSTMERVLSLLNYCTWPKIEAVKLFKMTIFNYLVGNEDMHLKNFSVITRERKVTLSPAYDLLNTTIAQRNVKEELALSLNGKKSNLKKNDFLNYFAIEQLQLNEKVIKSVLQELDQILPAWETLIADSFLSKAMQEKYLTLLNDRCKRLL